MDGVCSWAKRKRVNVEDIEELRSLRPMPPKFTFRTPNLHEDGAVQVGTKISIVPEAGSTHGIKIYFRHMSTPSAKVG